MVPQSSDSSVLPMIVTEHKWGDRGLAFHPKGLYLASVGSEDNDIRVWDRSSGELVQCLKGHTRRVQCITYSDDFDTVYDHGYILISAGWDKTIRFWDVKVGRELGRIETVTEINSIVYVHRGRLAAGGEDGVIYYWSFDISGRDLTVWPSIINFYEYGQLVGHQSSVRSIAYAISPSAIAMLVSASSDQTVRLWSEPPYGKELHRLPIPGCRDVAFSPDGTKLAVAKTILHNEALELWDSLSGQRLPFSSLALTGEYSNCVDFASYDVREAMALLSSDREASSVTHGILGGYFDFLAVGITKQSDPPRTKVVFCSEDSENRIDCYLECPMGSIEQIKVWEGYYLAVGGRDGICLWGPQSISPGSFIMRELARRKRRIQEEEQRRELARQIQVEREKLQSQAWLASGCCTACGQKLGMMERLRGNTRCAAHR